MGGALSGIAVNGKDEAVDNFVFNKEKKRKRNRNS
jgi:hypothetical protein